MRGKSDCLNVIHMSPRITPEPKSVRDLRRLREKLGLSREDLALATGWSTRQIARWEAGECKVREVVFQYLLSLECPRMKPNEAAFTFIDLFAGIGGFRLGFESVGGQCLFTSEWNEYAQRTYIANFGAHAIHGDITKVPEEEIPDHDVLVAGFPCQPFSIAGVSKKNALGRKHGFECETQGTLFFDIERIIEARQPRAFVLENVKNLASHDGGRTFDVIMRNLTRKLGYRTTHRIIDARRFVPQHRERVFIVGLHPELDATFNWKDVELPTLDSGPTLGTILHGRGWNGEEDPRYTDDRGKALSKYTLSDHLWEYLQGYALKHQSKGNGFGFGLVGPNDVARTLSARYYKDGSEILIKRGRGNPRRLTPRECARLMGFDRPGKPIFRIPVSDTQAYKQFGNAVVVPVVEAIAKALLPYLRGEKSGATEREILELTAA